MKELSIEEKAKLYEKAIKRAKSKIKNDKNHVLYEDDIVEIFSELKESEDERIKKIIEVSLKSYFDGTLSEGTNDTDYAMCLTWLEKQGEKVEPIEGFNTEFERQVSCLIASIINKEHEYTEAFVKWTSDTLLNYAKHEIDKQSEQKPILNFNANDWYVSKTDSKIHNMHHLVDKVEPKFNVGDYVKNVNDKREPIYEIVYMDKECYICEYRGKERMGDKAVMHFAFDNPYLRLVEPKFKG